MIPLSSAQLAEIVGGTLHLAEGEDAARIQQGVSTNDSREVEAGGIFFALPGETTDGHRFAEQAVARGAALLFVQEPLPLPVTQIQVSSTLAALAVLAKEVVARVRALGGLQVVAVTGSNGKTSTKNMLRAVLGAHGETVAPRGSYNNRVGAPLSMLQLTETTRYLVVEIGANSKGDVARLAALCHPDVGIVLKVGASHLRTFGSIETTAATKGELIEALGPAGHAVLNADDPRVAAMAERSAAPVTFFGTEPPRTEPSGTEQGQASGTAAELIWAGQLHTSLDGTTAAVHAPGQPERELRLRILGEHQVLNALAALSAAHCLGLDWDVSLAALAEMPRAERWRMELLRRADGLTVINDAYNASTDSMVAALKTLAQLAEPGRRTVAVLGEMLNLGEQSRNEHDSIGRLVVRLNLDKLYVLGEGARAIHLAAQHEGSWADEAVFVPTIEELERMLAAELRPTDVVLVKASEAVKLRFLADRLGGIEE